LHHNKKSKSVVVSFNCRRRCSLGVPRRKNFVLRCLTELVVEEDFFLGLHCAQRNEEKSGEQVRADRVLTKKKRWQPRLPFDRDITNVKIEANCHHIGNVMMIDKMSNGPGIATPFNAEARILSFF